MHFLDISNRLCSLFGGPGTHVDVGAMFYQVGYGIVAPVVWSVQLFEIYGERKDLHAGIPTCDYEYFALENGESVGMESHVESEYLSWCVKV